MSTYMKNFSEQGFVPEFILSNPPLFGFAMLCISAAAIYAYKKKPINFSFFNGQPPLSNDRQVISLSSAAPTTEVILSTRMGDSHSYPGSKGGRLRRKNRSPLPEEKINPEYIPMISDGNFDGGVAFDTFVQHTNQKEQTAKILTRLIEKLFDRNVFHKDEEFNLFDIGCADAQTVIKLVSELVKARSEAGLQPLNINFYGVENDPRFCDLAKENLRKCGLFNKFGIIQSDAFSADLFEKEFVTESLTKEKETASLRAIKQNLVFGSHVAYYAAGKLQLQRFIHNYASLLDSDHGVMIMVHEDDTGSTRAVYGPRGTPFELGRNVHSWIQTAALTASVQAGQTLGHSNSTAFTSTLRFPVVLSEQKDFVDKLKDTANYNIYARETPYFVEMVHLLAFFAQNSLQQIEKLSDFLTEFICFIAKTGAFTLKSQIQAITAPNSSAKLRADLKEVMTALQAEIPRIQETVDEPDKLAPRYPTLGSRH